MKILTMISTLSLVSLSNVTMANNNYGYKCQHGNEQRKIEVVYLQRESFLPCEVRYIKKHSNKKLWGASYEKGYCEAEARKFMKIQEKWGWHCKKEMPTTPTT